MKFHTFISILVLLAFTACKKDNIKPQPDEGYPTTYCKLTAAEWDSRYAELQSLNEGNNLTIDEYGFLEGKFKISEEINKDYFLSKIDSIIKTFGEFMGIKDYNSIDLSDELYVSDFCLQYTHNDIDEYFTLRDTVLKYAPEELPTIQYFHTRQQGTFNSHERPTIVFKLNEFEKTIAITGHWYPVIFKPTGVIYTADEALKIVYNSTDYECKKDENNECIYLPVHKVFLPIRINETIELRECWQIRIIISICPLYGYVDTQTGELLKVEGYYCNDVLSDPCEYYYYLDNNYPF